MAKSKGYGTENAEPSKCQKSPRNCHILHTVLHVLEGLLNLCSMLKDTFTVKTDPDDNRRFIYHAKDECQKNHKESDTSASNDGRIYEIPGKTIVWS